MCIFSRAVAHVAATRIFVGEQPAGRQALIYAMEVEVAAPTAMILPLPTPVDAGEDAVHFVSLADYRDLFDDLARAFPVTTMGLAPQPASRHAPPRRAPLVVHRVGAFVASFAPTAADLDRLDPQFRLSAAARAAATRDRDGWSFAVVQLAPAHRVHVHPIALTFPRRDPAALYVPTTHVHGDDVPAAAAFDHAIYYQPNAAVAATTPDPAGSGPIDRFVDLARTGGLVGAAPTFRLGLHGVLANDDVDIRLPPGVTAADVADAGPGWQFQLGVRFGYDLAPGAARRRDQPVATVAEPGAPPHLARWHRTARTRGSALAAAIRGWCRELAATGALVPLHPSLHACYWNGDRLWSATTAAQIPAGPGAVDLRVWTQHVEFQHVTVGVPDLATAELHAWRASLAAALDRAAT